MAYEFFLNGVMLPVTPSKIETKIKNQNNTLNLINDGEINFLKSAGLTEFRFEAIFPRFHLPFCNIETRDQLYYLDMLEHLKTSCKPFPFAISRTDSNGKWLFGNSVLVSLESYKLDEDAKSLGLDISATIDLKQWRHYATKTRAATLEELEHGRKAILITDTREHLNAPAKKTHTVAKGDCLWNIAKKYMGNGSKYPSLYSANQSVIDGKNKGTGNPKYTIYPGQVLTIP